MGDFLHEVLWADEKLEDIALEKIVNESDQKGYASMDVFYQSLSK